MFWSSPDSVVTALPVPAVVIVMDGRLAAEYLAVAVAGVAARVAPGHTSISIVWYEDEAGADRVTVKVVDEVAVAVNIVP
jgi:hypothetical protein